MKGAHLVIVALLALCAHAYVTPRGESGCVTVVNESGFHIEHVGEDIIVTTSTEQLVIPPCKTGLTHGPAWKAWAQYLNNSKITSLYGKWTVPPAPQKKSQATLFWWNGIEPADNSAVLQPVLQWGESAAGGGEYWALASWFVSSSHGTIVSNLDNVDTGDVIEGNCTLLQNGTWVITGSVAAKNINTAFSYTPEEDYVYAYEVLEAYDIAECTDYPKVGVVSFTDIAVQVNGQPVVPTWDPLIQKPITCDEHATVNSPTSVDIYY